VNGILTQVNRILGLDPRRLPPGVRREILDSFHKGFFPTLVLPAGVRFHGRSCRRWFQRGYSYDDPALRENTRCPRPFKHNLAMTQTDPLLVGVKIGDRAARAENNPDGRLSRSAGTSARSRPSLTDKFRCLGVSAFSTFFDAHVVSHLSYRRPLERVRIASTPQRFRSSSSWRPNFPLEAPPQVEVWS
jgi:hypothetical protein